jgi:hypothetical protein
MAAGTGPCDMAEWMCTAPTDLASYRWLVRLSMTLTHPVGSLDNATISAVTSTVVRTAGVEPSDALVAVITLGDQVGSTRHHGARGRSLFNVTLGVRDESGAVATAIVDELRPEVAALGLAESWLKVEMALPPLLERGVTPQELTTYEQLRGAILAP